MFAVSPLGQALSTTEPDQAYAAAGPESRGFVVDEEGNRTDDLLTPVQWLLSLPGDW